MSISRNSFNTKDYENAYKKSYFTALFAATYHVTFQKEEKEALKKAKSAANELLELLERADKSFENKEIQAKFFKREFQKSDLKKLFNAVQFNREIDLEQHDKDLYENTFKMFKNTDERNKILNSFRHNIRFYRDHFNIYDESCSISKKRSLFLTRNIKRHLDGIMTETELHERFKQTYSQKTTQSLNKEIDKGFENHHIRAYKKFKIKHDLMDKTAFEIMDLTSIIFKENGASEIAEQMVRIAKLSKKIGDRKRPHEMAAMMLLVIEEGEVIGFSKSKKYINEYQNLEDVLTERLINKRKKDSLNDKKIKEIEDDKKKEIEQEKKENKRKTLKLR